VGSPAPKIISPSRLARFYFHECERFLRFSSVLREERAAEGVPDPPYDPRPVTKAILDSGARWEEEVLDDLLPGPVHIAEADADAPVSERMFDQATARNLIKSFEPGSYVYQPELAVPEPFYQRYNLDPDIVRWSACRPDLIECIEADGELHLRVIDIKASPGVKLSHRIQATVYSLILETLLEDWGASDRRIADEGGIWLAQHPEPEYFELRMLRPPIQQFLEHELQPLLAQPADAAPWHVYFRCEWCEWFDHCRAEMRETDSVSRMPYLTTHAKRYLAAMDEPIDALPEFADLLDEPRRHGELDGCASLRGKGPRLQTQVAALREEEVKSLGGSSLAMPMYEHVRLVLTAQTEPVSGQLYAFGLYAQGLRDVFGENRTIAHVASDGDIDTIVALQRDLVAQLWEIFEAVDAYNRDREWRAQKSLQVFVFDTYERQLIVEALLQRLADPEVAERALKVLFQLQGPDLLQAEEHPASEVFFPMIVIGDVLRERLALPTEVTYRFGDAVNLLQPSEYGFEYSDNEYFSFALSNQLRSDAIYAVWYDGKAERIEWIENEIKARLWATNSLVNGARESLHDAGALFAHPPKFLLPASFDYSSPLLSRLAFLAQYESVLRYLDVRTRRMSPLSEQLRAGDAVLIRWTGGDRFAVEAISENIELSEEPFPSWLLAERNDEGQRALLGFDDYWNRARVWVRKGLTLRLAGIHGVTGSPATELRLELTAGPDSPELSEDAEYILCRRFTDFTTQHTVAELCEIDEGAYDGSFLELIEDPGAFARQTGIDSELRERALGLAEAHGMTPSKLEAFEGMLDRRLQLVWGPPGTGKTHFLALAVLCLAESYRAAGLPLRVMLTAFTHAAIENALRKIDQLQRERAIVEDQYAIGKLGGVVLNAGQNCESVDRDAGDAWLGAHEHAVLGGTVWALRRTTPATADLVMIDEASQLLVPSSAIAVRRLAPDGRLVMAGDDRQLPPIVLGPYPEPEEGKPYLHRSVFECVRRTAAGEELTATLLENWRMNETLCRYPREQIYVPDYESATDAIRDRRLRLADGAGEWIDELVDSEYPLVVCVLEGVQAAAENIIEAGLVSDCATRLRERLSDDDIEPYPDNRAGDEAFWRHGLFIVSPHHAQIRAITGALAEQREWHAYPFVDTVDKMQGQECDAVIVSYGVSDVEYALSEKEFIYSLNRLNVAITRARSKTIVFLPLPLLEPPVAAFEDDAIAEGIAFMQGLWRFAEVEGESGERRLDGMSRVLTYRVPAG
jgi:DNA replication ATP-dependent helicase Dna2